MARHIITFHLNLAQLWWCPVSWCTQWKGMPQDCIDHLRQKHSAPTSAKAATLGCWFPPWTVTREVWHQALKQDVSGISTDVLLFSEYGYTLVHHYLVFGRGAAHAALRGPFMAKLRSWPKLSGRMVVALYERLLYQRLRIICVALDPGIQTMRCSTPGQLHLMLRELMFRHQYTHFSTGGRPRLAQVSLRMPRFADKDFIPSAIQSVLVATMPYPSFPESPASTACLDLDAFVSEESGLSKGCRWTSMVERDRESVSSGTSGADEQSDMLCELSRFRPVDIHVSPIPDNDSQDVVESPSHYVLLDTVAHMSQVSALLSVQLSTNRVREECTSATTDAFPVYQVSPDTTGYLPATSHVSPPIYLSTDFLPPGATG